MGSGSSTPVKQFSRESSVESSPHPNRVMEEGKVSEEAEEEEGAPPHLVGWGEESLEEDGRRNKVLLPPLQDQGGAVRRLQKHLWGPGTTKVEAL